MARVLGERKVRLMDNSLVVVIPANVCRELHIKEQDSVVFRMDYKSGKVELDKSKS